MLKNFAQVRQAAKDAAGFVMAVAKAEDDASVEAAVHAHKEGLADSILVGRAEVIRAKVRSVGGDPADFEIVDRADEQACADEVVRLAAAGQAHVLLKGALPTSVLMRSVFRKEGGLRTGRIVSDVRLFDHPFKDEGFLAVTDGGVIPAPNLEQKRAIVENAVWVYHRLGIERPYVAALCAVEKVQPGMIHTEEARQLKEWNQDGTISGCVVEGPISLDLALIRKAVEIKGYESPVAANADILLGPTIESVNFLGKGLVYFKGCVPGQVVVGAKVPVLITSRADSAEVKLNSVALAATVALR